MLPQVSCFSFQVRLLGLLAVAGIVLVSCGPTSNQPAAPIDPYDRAKVDFKSGRVDRALEVTDKLARTTPPADSTERARVLRAVIFTGELKGSRELAEAYGKGAEKSKNPQFESDYRRLHNDNLFSASRAALNLAETAHEIARDGTIAKELTLEASFPTTEGPAEVTELVRVKEGGWLEPDRQDVAAGDAMRKGIDDALADVFSGDRAKARVALAGGSAKLNGAVFAVFLSKELAYGAEVFDVHHGRDPQKLIILCDEGDVTLKAAQDRLKETPDKDLQEQVKKLHDRFQTIRKDK